MSTAVDAAAAGAAATAVSGAGAGVGAGGWRRLSDALARFLLQHGDAIARLAQAVVELAEILLQGFGLLGRPVEILVDLIDVVPLDPETELDGAQCVEDGGGGGRTIHGGRVYPSAFAMGKVFINAPGQG